MKHTSLASLAFTIIVAAFCGAWISHHHAEEAAIQTLLSSSSSIDQVAGIRKVKHASFDSLVSRLTPLLNSDPKVSKIASEVLIQSALKNSCVKKLATFNVDPAMFKAALWWSSNKTSVPPNPERCAQACSNETVPWLRRLASLGCESLDEACATTLVTMPLLDRDGSILLATLSIDKHANDEHTALWNTSIDTDQRKIAILLRGLRDEHIEQGDSEPTLQNLITIINEQNGTLAWRTMHNRDGFIDPDIFLAGLIADRERFLHVLIETVESDQWQHPEHAVELARAFVPEIVCFLPESLLNTSETRKQWWDRFACGLLLEKR